VTDLKKDFNNTASPAVAADFVGTSVTSRGPFEQFNTMLAENPHIHFFDSRERDYVRVEVTPSRWRSELRSVSTITEPQAAAHTLAGAPPA
jgi:alkaline phosphatase D